MGRRTANPSASATRVRCAFTDIQKGQICQMRQQSEYKSIKLSEFGAVFKDWPGAKGQPVAASTLSDILRNKDHWLLWADPKKLGSGARKQKQRSAQFPILESHVVEWVDRANEQRVHVTDHVLLLVAEKFAKQLMQVLTHPEDYSDFKFSSGWLANLKARHGLGKCRYRGEGGDFDESTLPALRETLRKQLMEFALRDIYDCDEFGLQYNLAPTHTISRTSSKPRGKKKQKTRITVFLTINADGSDRRKIMVINKYKRPQCFTQNKINADNLPVTWRFNKKAWMLSGLWYEYLHELDKQMQKEGRHIALLTDNCPSHPPIDSPPKDYKGPPPTPLRNITLIYLPPNTTPFLQPLDAGIISIFKANYRRKWAESQVEWFAKYAESRPNWTVLETLRVCADIWEAFPPSVIYHCWKRCGIVSMMDRWTHKDYEKYVEHIRTGTRVSISSLLVSETTPASSSSQLSNEISQITEEFLFFEEDGAEREAEIGDVSVGGVIQDLEKAALQEEEIEEAPGPERPPEKPALSVNQAVMALTQVEELLQSLKHSELAVPGHENIVVADTVCFLGRLSHALQHSQRQHLRQPTLSEYLENRKEKAQRSEEAYGDSWYLEQMDLD